MELPVRWKWKLNRLRQRINDFFAKREEEETPRPKLCPACHTLVGANQSRCHECGVSMTFSLAAASQSLRRWMPQENPASYTILAISALLYIISLLGTMSVSEGPLSGYSGGFWGLLNLFPIDSRLLARLGESLPWPWIIGLREPWRYVTAIFLHASLIHIIFNMWFLLDLGPVAEELYGSARFLYLYIVTGICGFFLSSIMMTAAVGGSCSLVGIVGALFAATSGHRTGTMGAYRQQLIRWIIYIAIFSMMRGVSWQGHVGGFVTGFVLGKIMAPNPPLNPKDRKRAHLMGWAAGLVVAASFAAMIFTYYRP